MGWISNLLNKSAVDETPSLSTGFHDLEGHPVPLSVAAGDVRAAREMVHGAAVRAVSMYGLPPRWLSFEVVTISDEEKAYFQLQVLMTHWDEYLVAHSYAFERAVIKLIREEDVRVGRAVRAVLWRVAADAGCPFDEMPDPGEWSVEARRQRAEIRMGVMRAVGTDSAGKSASASAIGSALAEAGPGPLTFAPTVSTDDALGPETIPVHPDPETLPGQARSGDSPDVEGQGFSATQPGAEKKSK